VAATAAHMEDLEEGEIAEELDTGACKVWYWLQLLLSSLLTSLIRK
jgi:hypothetical protein